MTNGEDTVETKIPDASERAFAILIQPYARPDVTIPVKHYLPIKAGGCSVTDVWVWLDTVATAGHFTTRNEDGSPNTRIDLNGCVLQVQTWAEHERNMEELQKKQKEQQESLQQQLALGRLGVPGFPGVVAVPGRRG